MRPDKTREGRRRQDVLTEPQSSVAAVAVDLGFGLNWSLWAVAGVVDRTNLRHCPKNTVQKGR